MKLLESRIIKLEEKIKAKSKQQEKHTPLGTSLGISHEVFLNEFDGIAKLGQKNKLPGVPITWLRLSDEEKLSVVIDAFYQDELSNLSVIQLRALIEVLGLMERLEDGNLANEMKQPHVENSK